MAERHRDWLDRVLAEGAMLLVVLGLFGLLFLLVFAFSFGAADQEALAIRAEPLTADGVVDDATVELDAAGRAALTEAIATGSTRSLTNDEDPVFEAATWYQVHGDDGSEFVYVEHDGSVYRYGVANTSTVEVTAPTLGVVEVDETDGTVLEYRSLSGVDQQRFREALRHRQVTECDPNATGPTATRCWSVYEHDEVEGSALVPWPAAEYLSYRNQTYRLIVRERPITVRARHYTATRLTSDPAAFRTRLVTDVDPAALDDREREMFEQAVEDEFRVGQSRHDLGSFPEERIDGLLAKLGLPPVHALRPGHHGRAVSYVRLGDTYYRVVVEYYDTYA